MMGRATMLAVLALLIAGATAAQTPEPPEPAGPEDADIAMPSDPEDAGVAMPGDVDGADLVLPGRPGDAAIATPGELENAGIALADEEETPEFPPGLDAIIAVHPLDPRLDQQAPWLITADGTVIPQRRAPKPPIPVFRAPLTDAFSSRTEDSAIELTFGGQTSLGGTLGVRVSRLETAPAVVELAVGESLALDDLTVRAFDTDGELVARTPLRLEFEGPEGFVDMTAFEQDKRTLSAVARGIGRIWVTSLLPASQNEPFSIPVVLAVHEPGNRGARLSARIHENVPASP